MDNCHLRTVLDFMVAAQTLTAIYGSPDGPTDPERYYEQMSSLMDDPHLLVAQHALSPQKLVLVVSEQLIPLHVVPAH